MDVLQVNADFQRSLSQLNELKLEDAKAQGGSNCWSMLKNKGS